MTNEVNQRLNSPKEDPPIPEDLSQVAIPPSVEKETNVMTLEELDLLRESYSFLPSVQIIIPDENETITSSLPSEVTFYEAAFPTGTYSALIVIPNRTTTSYTSRRGTRRPCSEDTPTTSRGGKANFSSFRGMTESFLKVHLGKLVLQGPEIVGYPRLFSSPEPMAFGNIGEDQPIDGATSSSGNTAMLKRISFKKLGENVEKSKAECSAMKSTPAKGMVIGEKPLRKDSARSPSKEGCATGSPKGKEVASVPEAKKKTARPSYMASPQPLLRQSPRKASRLALPLLWDLELLFWPSPPSLRRSWGE
ncbi:hypothetical protein Acr_12g0002030 [Actinidia rufa]|uniref:Uncharacterized protein n=1 Tax=Actinidia rufa TaxID=165716 RepID=A0A7J0FG38_9ERIC|nr:hypothetical protein Acr_12g0002030 [Actinidia rufa]